MIDSKNRDSMNQQFLSCSGCFVDNGLAMDAEKIGIENPDVCPNCGSTDGKKLNSEILAKLAYRFFVWGSICRVDYGGAPVIQFNESQKTSIEVSPGLDSDIKLFERLLGIGFFYYGPRLCMVGEIEPLRALQDHRDQQGIIDRILQEYPERDLGPSTCFYRIRKIQTRPDQRFNANQPLQYDSPPDSCSGNHRLNSKFLPVLYGSMDLQTCIHECRVTAEDDLYVATLSPSYSLRFLDLFTVLEESGVTEFESLDLAVYMLFLAGPHSYAITQKIAVAARRRGFHGIIYPSYFSLLRLGIVPFDTTYGLINRWIPQTKHFEQYKVVPNIAVFGRPVKDRLLNVKCINKLIISKVEYDYHFGPII